MRLLKTMHSANWFRSPFPHHDTQWEIGCKGDLQNCCVSCFSCLFQVKPQQIILVWFWKQCFLRVTLWFNRFNHRFRLGLLLSWSCAPLRVLTEVAEYQIEQFSPKLRVLMVNILSDMNTIPYFLIIIYWDHSVILSLRFRGNSENN